MSDKHSLGITYYEIKDDDYDMSFKFEYMEQTDGTINIYILQQPDYAPGQPTDGHSTHRYGLGDNRPYICYEPMPKDLSSAKEILEGWARRTAYYIKHKKWVNA